jgi:alpha-glucoside transport system permease protein
LKFRKAIEQARPFIWLTPALLLLLIFFIIPTIQTVWLSLNTKIEYRESGIEKELIDVLSSSGMTVTRKTRVSSIENWKTHITKVCDRLGIVLDNDRIIRLTVRETSELLIMKLNAKADRTGSLSRFTGLTQYLSLARDPSMRTALRNNLVWVLFFTVFTIVLGMSAALLIERVGWGMVARTILFTPMAVSYVAASVIWSFMYDASAVTGTVNAILKFLVPVVTLGFKSFSEVAWLGSRYTVNLALIAAGIWMWTGFCTVIFTAAIRSVPDEMLEAAHIEGAGPVQLFFRIILPSIRSTVLVVTTTMVINVLKIFDLVYTMTDGGPFGESEVVANYMYRTAFIDKNFQYASAMAVILFMAVIPVLIANVRNLFIEESVH